MTWRGHRLALGVDQVHPEAAEPAVDRPLEVLDRRVVRHAEVHHRVVVHRRHVRQVVRAGRDRELVLRRVHRDADRRGRRPARGPPGPKRRASVLHTIMQAPRRGTGPGTRHCAASGRRTSYARPTSSARDRRKRAELLRAQGQCQAAARRRVLVLVAAGRVAGGGRASGAGAHLSPACRASSCHRPRPGCTAWSAGSSRRGAATASSAASPRPRWRWARTFPVVALRRGPAAGDARLRHPGVRALQPGRPEERAHQQRLGRRPQHHRGRSAPGRLTGEVYHESSHLGDEYGDRFDAARLDWTREVAAAWVTLRHRPAQRHRQPELRADRRAGSRPPGRRAGGGLPRAGRSARSWAGRCGRSAASSSRARPPPAGGSAARPSSGVALAAACGGREVGIALIAHDGLSTQRQFFRRESRYIGAELRFDL